MAASGANTAVAICPSCNASLEFDDHLAGHRVRCPRCRNPFLAPSDSQEKDSDPFPPWLIAFLSIAGFTVLCLFLAFAIGLGQSLLLTFVLAAIALLIWQRQLAIQILSRFSQFAAARLQDAASQFSRSQTPLTPSAPSSFSDSSPEALHESEKSVETRIPFKISPIPSPTIPSSTWSVGKWIRGATATEVRFFGPGTTLGLAGVPVNSPLVYFVNDTVRVPFDASLIEATLPVASSAEGYVEDLPYWPNYRGCSPKQRRKYLEWLTTGRRLTDVPIGYVFIFFYGLERRALCDKSDAVPILRETLRLLDLYAQQSGSFRSYASAFLWAAVMAAPDVSDIDDALIADLAKATRRWSDESLAALLSWLYRRGQPLSPKAALLIAQQDPRTPRSVVVRRHPDQFEELFVARYAARFGKGIVLKPAKNDHVFQYRPASATLPALFGGSCFSRRISDVRGISSQFKPLLELWSETIDDLKAFDRAERKANGRVMTAAMYETLPRELREDDHPDYKVWCEVIDRYTNRAGWTAVPVSELAAVRGISHRNRLTKAQSQELARAAETMELSLEPDARISGQSYHWDELVSIFPRESESDENLKTYHAASILLRLGMTIAAADGEISSIEVRRITSQLREQFRLSDQDSARLDHLAHLLELRPPDDAHLASKLAHLPPNERGLIGEFLISVAAADEIVTADEVRALKKAYRHLGLDPTSLETLTAGRVRVSGQPSNVTDQLVLDPSRIRQIMSETAKVAELLSRVMLDDDSEQAASTPQTAGLSGGPAPTTVHSTASSIWAATAPPSAAPATVAGDAAGEQHELSGLPVRFRDFAMIASSKPVWNRRELEQIARQHNVMLSGALEAINEWSLEHCGDWLFQEDGDSLTVNRACIAKK